MELPSKLLEQIVFNTRSKIEEHMLVVMDKTAHEEHLSQPLHTNNKQFKIAVTFLTGYNGLFNITNKKNMFYFKKLITDEDDFIRISIIPGAYEIEALHNEIEKINVEKVYLTNEDSPFSMKPNFSTLGSFIEKFPQRPITSFASDNSIRSLLGFQETILYEEYYLSPNPVDILSFDNVFLECDIAKKLLFKGRRSNINHNWTMTVDPGYKHVENLREVFFCI